MRELEGRWCARGGLGENRGSGQDQIFRERQGSNRGKNGYPLAGLGLRGRLVTQVAVRAVRVVIRAVIVPAAADDCGKHEQREQRQRNAKNANGLS